MKRQFRDWDKLYAQYKQTNLSVAAFAEKRKIPQASVYLACGVTDLRNNINGLALLVQRKFNLDPFSNALFVFCNRKRDKLRKEQLSRSYRKKELFVFKHTCRSRCKLHTV